MPPAHTCIHTQQAGTCTRPHTGTLASLWRSEPWAWLRTSFSGAVPSGRTCRLGQGTGMGTAVRGRGWQGRGRGRLRDGPPAGETPAGRTPCCGCTGPRPEGALGQVAVCPGRAELGPLTLRAGLSRLGWQWPWQPPVTQEPHRRGHAPHPGPRALRRAGTWGGHAWPGAARAQDPAEGAGSALGPRAGVRWRTSPPPGEGPLRRGRRRRV